MTKQNIDEKLVDTKHRITDASPDDRVRTTLKLRSATEKIDSNSTYRVPDVDMDDDFFDNVPV